MLRKILTLAAVLLIFSAGLPFNAHADTITLTLWHNHPEWKDRAQKILDAFEAKNPGIHIQLEEKPGDVYDPAIKTALAADEAPDMFGLNTGVLLSGAARAGQLLDLTPYIDPATLTPAAADGVTVDGKIWGVPGFGAYTVGVYYNRDIFDANQLKPPTTWEEIFTLCKTFQDKKIVPWVMPAKDGIVPFFFYSLATDSIIGVKGFEQLKRGEIKLTDANVLRSTQLLRKIYNCFQEGSLSTSYVEGKALFAQGRGAMMIGGSADYAGFLEVNPKANLGVIPFPPPADGGFPITVSGLEMPITVNPKVANKDAAIAFIKFMASKDAAQMVADTITLPTVAGVSPSNNRVMAEMVAASKNNARVWYEFTPTGGIFDLFTTKSQLLFTDDLTPEQFAKLLQDSIKPEPAK